VLLPAGKILDTRTTGIIKQGDEVINWGFFLVRFLLHEVGLTQLSCISTMGRLPMPLAVSVPML